MSLQPTPRGDVRFLSPASGATPNVRARVRPASHRVALALLLAGSAWLAGCGTTTQDIDPNSTAERLYREAKDDIGSGGFDRAIKTLERVEGLAAGTLLAQQALLDLAHAQWKSGDRESALTSVDRFIKLNPSSPAFDYALYLRGSINFIDNLGLFGNLFNQQLSERDQRAARESWRSFKQLVDQFPNSRYAPDARLRMNFIVNSLAAYEVNVARYYLRRGAYVAAANRAQQAVAEYQQTPAVEEALFIMMASYDKLELNDLRDAAERVLQKNFPNSAFLRRDLASERPWWRFW